MLAKLQTGFRPREERITVLIPSRMRVGSAWTDVVIHNVSSRGLMGGCDTPPAPGSYIEVRRGTIVIVGRVMWGKGRFFGVRTQDRISVKALIDEPRLAGRPQPKAQDAGTERRAENRLAHEARMARSVERSRAFSSMFQYVGIVLTIIAAVGLGGSIIYGALTEKVATVTQALEVK
ncbi:PilZ domain-containing protein [Sphingomonas adhaesiva]|uniref:PilZ domain-containing protein n=1 Tax=Sphingomonas adhaesiva TaxID=28212 RepID=UPI002FF81AB5